jgi:hypothetical protein
MEAGDNLTTPKMDLKFLNFTQLSVLLLVPFYCYSENNLFVRLILLDLVIVTRCIIAFK